MARQRVISAVLTLRDRNFASGATRASNNTRDLERKVKSAGNAINKFGRNAKDSFSGVARSVIGLAGAYLGINALKDLSVSMIESAASAQAMSAQFEQVFGDMESKAQSSIDELGKSFGMMSERIKPGYTKVTSMFKGFGMSTEASMEAASRAVTLSADAAAFYDVSMSNSQDAITSFLKGNTNAAESIGIFATAAGIADFAAKELKKDWKKLDEGGKQLVRLKYVEKMQESAGATGQASRESEGLENVLGNLKSSWETLKSKFGVPILEPAIKGMQKLSGMMEGIDTDTIINKFSRFGSIIKGAFDKIKPGLSWLKDTALPNIKDTVLGLYDQAKPGIDWIKDTAVPMIVEGIKGLLDNAVSFYTFIKDNWSLIGPVVAGITAGVLAFKVGIVAVSAATKIWSAVTTAAQFAMALLNGTISLSPLGWVAIAIGAVVAVGILLYKNWDTIREKATGLWTTLTEAWTGIKEGFSGMWTNLKDSAKDGVNFIIDKLNGLINGFNSFSNFKLPDWLGGHEIGFSIPTIPAFAKGTNYAPGGLAQVNERGGEIIDLPSGSRVYPHDKSVQMARSEGKGVTIENITINGVNLTADQIADELVYKIKLRLANI